jgi:dephospho-CoA kinase
VHVCNSGGHWGRDELLFRDYLAANSAARDQYAALKRDLMARWHDDRQAYGEAKTAFVLDALERARIWAAQCRWQP